MRTKTAIAEQLKTDPDLRFFYKRCYDTSAFRLRSQGYQFRQVLAERGYVASLESVQDTLFELARDLFPESPGADFITWAGLLCGDVMARLQEHYTSLSAAEKEAVDVSGAWCHNGAVEDACRNQNLAVLREAIKIYECEALEELRAVQGRSGAT